MANARDEQFKAIFVKAQEAAQKAFCAARPRPMVVGQAKSLFSDEIDYEQPVEVVDDGVCGFAWLHFPDGRKPFVRWLKKNNIGGRTYTRGYTVWSSYLVPGDRTQSMERKEAACRAAAKVLNDADITCYMQSRMD